MLIRKSIGYSSDAERVGRTNRQHQCLSVDCKRLPILYAGCTGLAFPWEFRGRGESGKSLQGLGMQWLLAMVDAKKVQTVIVAKVDRLSRSLKDLCELLERFERRGVCSHLGSGVIGHQLRRWPLGPEHHDGGFPIGARGHWRTNAGRDEPQAQ